MPIRLLCSGIPIVSEPEVPTLVGTLPEGLGLPVVEDVSSQQAELQ